MNSTSGLDLPPLFRCASDTPDAPLLGYHDGISSWTLNAAADPDGLRQAFVSHHERAHHQLHASSAWGTAMLVTGLADEYGQVAVSQWQDLAGACLETHEAYATFAAVAQVRDGLDILVGNFRYLQYLRRAQVIAGVFDEHVADAGLHLIMHLLMTPRALLNLGPDDLRRPDIVEQLIRDHAPDQRFAALRQRLADDALRRSLRELIPDEDTVVDVVAVSALLCGAGVDTPEPDAVSTWITGTIEALRPSHPSLVAEPLGSSDRLTLFRPGFDGDIETWEKIKLCRHRRSTPMNCVSVRPGSSSRPAGIRRPRSGRSGGSPGSSGFIRRRCGSG